MSAQKIFNPGKSDKRTANRLMDQQTNFANEQMGQFQHAMPQYQQAINFLMGNAGLGQTGVPASNDVYAQRRGINTVQQDPNLGIWNNPTDRFRMAQAQDDIDRYQMQQQNQLRHNLGGRGLMDSSVAGGAMERLASNAMRDYAGARRDLVISAPQEQERRVAMLMQALAPMLNMGQQAFQNYGDIAGNKMAQANQANSYLPQLFGTGAQIYGMSQGMPQGKRRTP